MLLIALRSHAVRELGYFSVFQHFIFHNLFIIFFCPLLRAIHFCLTSGVEPEPADFLFGHTLPHTISGVFIPKLSVSFLLNVKNQPTVGDIPKDIVSSVSILYHFLF